jgi:hypothetical protein
MSAAARTLRGAARLLAAAALLAVASQAYKCQPNAFMTAAGWCQGCAVGSFSSPGAQAGLYSGVQSSVSCFESFEAISLGGALAASNSFGNFLYAPAWNGWTFTSAAGISGAGAAWTSPAANAAEGAYFAYIQAGALNTPYAAMTRTLYNLAVGVPATVSFWVSWRNGYGPPTGSLAVTYNGAAVGTYTAVPGAWAQSSYTFTPAVASGNLVLTYTMTGPAAGDSISIDALTVNQASEPNGSCLVV